MKSINHIFFVGIFCTGLSAPAVAEQYQFRFSLETTDNTQEIPQVTLTDNITVNGQTLTAFNVSFPSVISDQNEWLNFTARAVTTKVKPHILSRLQLYAMPNGSILVPKDWQLINGGIGANGSVSYSFAPTQGNGYLTFYDTSACIGCAQSAASVFFPEAYKDAQENGFLAYDSTNMPITSVRLKPNLISYSVEQGKQRLDGIVYYNADDDFPFWKAEISLPSQDQDLANPLLNQFINKSEK
ncbi:DUF4850 domain-containing protein [Glaesserella sp.]|uniref:DUF4850 domain-containing protein n=1 Tax=Glaesserella sp. TaxID=2094731 RepID=UPI0035A12FB4